MHRGVGLTIFNAIREQDVIMILYSDEEFLQIAIERNFITQQHAQEALKLQTQMAEKKVIGDILLENKWILESQCNVVKIFLRYKTRKVPQVSPMEKKWGMEKDHELAQKALKEGLISTEKLIECVFKQKEMDCQGKSISLSTIMVEKGYILSSDLEYLEQGGTEATGKYPVQHPEKPVTNSSTNVSQLHFLAPILVGLSEPCKSRVFTLSKKENFIGRARGANIHIEHSSVSRIHCKLHYIEAQGWEIVDMMSTHGIFINETKIKKYLLRNRDKIQLGEVSLEIRGI